MSTMIARTSDFVTLAWRAKFALSELHASDFSIGLAAARKRMRNWALAWRAEVEKHGRSEISQAMLDLAVGWRSVAQKEAE